MRYLEFLSLAKSPVITEKKGDDKGSTSDLEKRCVSSVADKLSGSHRDRVSRAYAICRSSLQGSGRMKKGKAELTKKGRSAAGGKAKDDDHSDKVDRFEKLIKKARKGNGKDS